MSLTRSQVERLHEERFRQIDLRPGETEPQAPRLVRWLTEPGAVGGRWPGVVCLSWIAVYAMAILLEPPAANPDAPEPLWAMLLFFTLMCALGSACIGLARRQRLGLVASVGAAGLALGAAIMCPVSGHHQAVGTWWYLQMGGFTCLAGLSLVGLTRSRGSSARAS